MKLSAHEQSKLKSTDKKRPRGTGYHWDRLRNKWKVHVQFNGMHWYGGMFDDEQDAIKCITNKRKEMGIDILVP